MTQFPFLPVAKVCQLVSEGTKSKAVIQSPLGYKAAVHLMSRSKKNPKFNGLSPTPWNSSRSLSSSSSRSWYCS